MDDWDFTDEWDWPDSEDDEARLYELGEELAERFFLSDNNYLPQLLDDYHLGYLEARDWWPLLSQLNGLVDLERIADLAASLDGLLALPGLPTEVLEDPHTFLEEVLKGHLPTEPSGRRVSSRKLVKIALVLVEILKELPEPARAAVHAWAGVHRQLMARADLDDEEGLADMLFDPDLPPAMTGFTMVIALTLMRWPRRAEGLPLPDEFEDPGLYDEILVQWEALPDSPTTIGEGADQAEALFAQGQLAHMLAQMGTVELLSSDGADEQDSALAYSRLSRSILWVHDRCRLCPERDGISCRAATGWPQRPVPLIDVAGEVANTGRVQGCVRM